MLWRWLIFRRGVYPDARRHMSTGGKNCSNCTLSSQWFLTSFLLRCVVFVEEWFSPFCVRERVQCVEPVARFGLEVCQSQRGRWMWVDVRVLNGFNKYLRDARHDLLSWFILPYTTQGATSLRRVAIAGTKIRGYRLRKFPNRISAIVCLRFDRYCVNIAIFCPIAVVVIKWLINLIGQRCQGPIIQR